MIAFFQTVQYEYKILSMYRSSCELCLVILLDLSISVFSLIKTTAFQKLALVLASGDMGGQIPILLDPLVELVSTFDL
jgi:hypothetical protein